MFWSSWSRLCAWTLVSALAPSPCSVIVGTWHRFLNFWSHPLDALKLLLLIDAACILALSCSNLFDSGSLAQPRTRPIHDSKKSSMLFLLSLCTFLRMLAKSFFWFWLIEKNFVWSHPWGLLRCDAWVTTWYHARPRSPFFQFPSVKHNGAAIERPASAQHWWDAVFCTPFYSLSLSFIYCEQANKCAMRAGLNFSRMWYCVT